MYIGRHGFPICRDWLGVNMPGECQSRGLGAYILQDAQSIVQLQ